MSGLLPTPTHKRRPRGPGGQESQGGNASSPLGSRFIALVAGGRVASEQAKNRLRGRSPGPRSDRSMVRAILTSSPAMLGNAKVCVLTQGLVEAIRDRLVTLFNRHLSGSGRGVSGTSGLDHRHDGAAGRCLTAKHQRCLRNARP